MSENNVLVTLDGSSRATRTIDYLCSFNPMKSRQLTLFNVITPVPESYYDLKSEPFSGSVVSRVRAWEAGQRAAMEAFLEDARTRLISAGYDKDKVSILMKSRKKGISRDILAESEKGYEALVIRRRGSANSLLAVNLGGVAAKLVDKAVALPLIVAGVQEVSHRLCIAVDGSKGAVRAVRFVGQMVAGSEVNILLCSVVRSAPFKSGDKVPDPFIGLENQALDSVTAAMDGAREILMADGIPEERIQVKVVHNAKSRAGALVEAAGEAGCDTLVFGRKGLSMVEDFDLGRIPRKVIYGSRKLTVWLVP